MITYLWEAKLVVALSRCFSAFQLLAAHIRVAATFKMLGHYRSDDLNKYSYNPDLRFAPDVF